MYLICAYFLQQTGSKIALKQMKHEVLMRLPERERQTMEKRMMQEIEIMFRLQHPNVIKAHTMPPEVCGKRNESEKRDRRRRNETMGLSEKWQKERKRERERERERERSEKERLRDRQAKRQTDRQTDTRTKRQRQKKVLIDQQSVPHVPQLKLYASRTLDTFPRLKPPWLWSRGHYYYETKCNSFFLVLTLNTENGMFRIDQYEQSLDFTVYTFMYCICLHAFHIFS